MPLKQVLRVNRHGGRVLSTGGSHPSSLVRALARLGWTRMGSPGIFGVRTRETPC
jgi:hypothetical protein